ncbi:iron ABC transporter permease [Flavobacterium sp. NRK F10]|uniref:iron ABC transporter permease n=1 Tax=Flavobacterium sp. NRK F10 TaxID=2954931 RepID=UPI002090B3DB|nr:iron ABC transporter permease [Flavobacterium sp. NRK F10]MCO6173963.1 iron ABC transporter permease [Flavobacterium sp. NRK F10]
MSMSSQHKLLFGILVLGSIALFLINISLGSVFIPVSEICKGILGFKMEKETWEIILFHFRLPKAVTAILVGIGLSVSGLLMQTLFRNPLAGPYVLGLSSGASLGVAFVILGSALLPVSVASFFLSTYGLTLASGIGSFLVLAAVLLVAKRLKDTMAILIVGLMFSSFTSAIVSVLTYFSTAEQLQKYTFWSLGSISNLSWEEVTLLFILIAIGLIFSITIIKPLNALLLGERYAKSIGIHFKRTRLIIIIATSILAGSTTALVGPIAFIGLAVPHMAKLLFKTSNHLVLLMSTLLLGSIMMLICDSIAQVPNSELTLPINAITSIFGAPIIVWLLIRKRKIQ